jgi:hypothetical protein
MKTKTTTTGPGDDVMTIPILVTMRVRPPAGSRKSSDRWRRDTVERVKHAVEDYAIAYGVETMESIAIMTPDGAVDERFSFEVHTDLDRLVATRRRCNGRPARPSAP